MTFSGGTFEYTEGRERNVVRDRGEPVEVTPGDSVGVTWGFEVKYEDRFSVRSVRDGVWNAQAETVTGLTGGALNANVALDYDYEQGSLQIAVGDAIFPGTKLAVAAVPAVANDFSENTGASNVEQVTTVAKAAAFNIFMPAADVDVDVTYDAVGAPTLQAAVAGGCEGAVQYFDLRFDIYDPCDPPSVLDVTQGTVVERITIPDCYLLEDSFSEDEEANSVTFSGESLRDKVTMVPIP